MWRLINVFTVDSAAWRNTATVPFQVRYRNQAPLTAYNIIFLQFSTKIWLGNAAYGNEKVANPLSTKLQ